ncbi:MULTISPECIES: glycerate kinase [Microbacterium]|uniref:glycerate kinase n=1 Tax=Microbacterium TaxID=33882 RepID=UPI00146D3E4C|nr:MULTISPECIES: glycerate kinase [Microbacterium]
MSAGPVVIALDSFKNSIGAAAAARAVRDGWRSVDPIRELRLLPMADGGEGTLDAFAASVPGATRMPVTVTGPDDRRVEASWLLLPPDQDAPCGTAVVELASTSGIELLGRPPRLRPLDADTRGFGEAIAAALAHGVSRLVLGIGSSASTDGGTGMLAALGARFTDASARAVPPGGRGLSSIAAADLSSLAALPPGGVTVLTDVTNPLCGAQGAAAVFAPQKGADPGTVTALDLGLGHLASLLAADPESPGAGAAGGTGFGLLAWGAQLVPGAQAVADLVGLQDAVATASLVVTGEGSYDGQSESGKAPALVRAVARAADVPTALVAGRIAPDVSTAEFAHALSLTVISGSADAALAEPARWLSAAGAELAQRFRR